MLILGASVLLLQVFATASATEAERYDTATNVTSRSGKALSIFQIIKFKVCQDMRYAFPIKLGPIAKPFYSSMIHAQEMEPGKEFAIPMPNAWP
eukprot:TCALIF_11356-PA protein Name:"Protein of unknown function" AED:0.55 eAED:0.84 QI:0/1/0/1/1/1/2/0/93